LLGTAIGLAMAGSLADAYNPFTPPFTGSAYQDFALLAFGAAAIGIPFFAIVILVLRLATREVLRHPFLWSVVLPAVLLALSLWKFPISESGGFFWVAAIPLCATCAGLLFYAWLRASPLETQIQS
jgi:hypothetical protein